MKKIILILCAFFTCALITRAHAQQQPGVIQRHNITPAEMRGATLAARYYYRVFTTPENEKGYDIFKNERLVFHQPAMAKQDNKTALTSTNKQVRSVESQAILSIEKLKKGLPPALTESERLAPVINIASN